MGRRSVVRGGTMVLALGLAACGDPAGPGPVQPDASSPVRSQDDASLHGIDRVFARTAREVPGFGGMFRAQDGSTVMYLKDPTRAAAARQALTKSGYIGSMSASVQVRAAANDYLELTSWRGRLRSGLATAGAGFTFLDIDETSNRIRIGVVPGTPHDAVESQLAALDVPAAAVEVVDAEPIRFMATLRDRVRPVRGGLQIVWPDTTGSLFVCTIGFNAHVPAHEGDYFVTNSHCSGTQGGVQNTPFYQHIPSPDNLIAREVADPQYFTAGCYTGYRCRFSDASLARYEPGVPVAYAALTRTTLRGLTAGSLTIDPLREFFYIEDRRPYSLVGETLDKVGRTTGWTVGTVAATCVDIGVAETDIVQLCQDEVFSGVGGGDSGSPVFQTATPGNNHVTLYGILWGGGTSSFGPIYAFSPLENIEYELGPLNVTFNQ